MLPNAESYDRIAAEYARRIYGELKDKPFDRQWLDRFADRVRPSGLVCDLGCGPGHVARYIFNRGVQALGLDRSAGMLAEAVRLNPGIPFLQGDMLALPFRDASLGGIVAFYSIIHVPRVGVPAALAEMFRALRRQGALLLAFHLGQGSLHSTDFHGQTVALDATLFELEEMIGYLQLAGFTIEQAAARDPYPEVEYQSRRGYIQAGKPAQ